MGKPRAITELLANQFPAPLEQAIQRGKKLRQLSQFVLNLLQPELAMHCHLLNIRNGTLLMACDSTVWATRLRYQLPALLQSLQQQAGLSELSDIQIRVRPAVQAPPQQPVRRVTLSADAAYCLEQCAKSVTDPALRNALEKLAGRKQKP